MLFIFLLIILFGRFRNLTSFHRSVCSFCHRSTITSSSLKSEKAKFIKTTTKTLYIHYNDKTKYKK